jgi:hypothetical protein
LPWHLKNDAEYILWGTDRIMMTVCDSFYSALVDHNFVDFAPQFHTVATLQDTAGKDRFCRKSVTVSESSTCYTPHALTPENLAAAQIKRGYFGCLFQGKLDSVTSLDSSAALFETQVMEDGNPHMRPTKVKQHLMGRLTMQMGKFYKLS